MENVCIKNGLLDKFVAAVVVFALVISAGFASSFDLVANAEEEQAQNLSAPAPASDSVADTPSTSATPDVTSAVSVNPPTDAQGAPAQSEQSPASSGTDAGTSSDASADASADVSVDNNSNQTDAAQGATDAEDTSTDSVELPDSVEPSVGVLAQSVPYEPFSAGTCHQGSPRRIHSAWQLAEIAAMVNAGNDALAKSCFGASTAKTDGDVYLEMDNDIDLNDLYGSGLNWTDPNGVQQTQGWVPIGFSGLTPFKAHLNSQTRDVKIYNLRIGSATSPANYDSSGLFGTVSESTISGLSVDVKIFSEQSVSTASIFAGGLAAKALGSKFKRIGVTGSINARARAVFAGGAIGIIADGGEFSQSFTNVSVTADTGNVSGDAVAGGIVAKSFGDLTGIPETISYTHADGPVHAKDSSGGSPTSQQLLAGGIIASIGAESSVHHNYATGDITADSGSYVKIGGIVGSEVSALASVKDNVALNRVVNTSAVSNQQVGRVIGNAMGTNNVNNYALESMMDGTYASTTCGNAPGNPISAAGNLFDGTNQDSGALNNKNGLSIDWSTTTPKLSDRNNAYDNFWTNAANWDEPFDENYYISGWDMNQDLPLIYGYNSRIRDQSSLMPAHIYGYGTAFFAYKNGAYQISTAWELAQLSCVVEYRFNSGLFNTSGVKYELTNDIDLSDLYDDGLTWTDPASRQQTQGWVPIGGPNSSQFNADFNGNGHQIMNLRIGSKDIPAAPTSPFIGLFGNIGSDSEIKNLGVPDAEIYTSTTTTDSTLVGVLAGLTYSSRTMNNVYASGKIEHTGKTNVFVGGLIGLIAANITLSDSYAKVNVRAQSTDSNRIVAVGGLVGYLPGANTTLDHTYASGDVYANSRAASGSGVGGLVGAMISSGSVKNSVALNRVVSNSGQSTILAGRIIGYITNGTVNKVYALQSMLDGSVTATCSGAEGKTIAEAGNAFDGAAGDTATVNDKNGLSVAYTSTTPSLSQSGPYFWGDDSLWDTSTWSSSWGFSGIGMPILSAMDHHQSPEYPDHIKDGLVPYFVGAGTSGDPYQIGTAWQLAQLSCLTQAQEPSFVGKEWKLTRDIDLSDLYGSGAKWTAPEGNAYTKGWKPIGPADSTAFSGKFDGDGHRVTKLRIKNDDGTPTEMYLSGLFGNLANDSEVTNLGVDVDIYLNNTSTRPFAGALAARAGQNVRISRVYTTGTVNATCTASPFSQVYAGGLFAEFGNGNIDHVYSRANVYAFSNTQSWAGGLIAIAGSDVSVNYAYATGDVTATEATSGASFGNIAGGLIAYGNDSTAITNSVALNQRVKAGNDGYDAIAGRIFGLNSRATQSGSLNNYAFSEMQLSSDGGANWAQAGTEGVAPQLNDDANGLGVSRNDLNSLDWWEAAGTYANPIGPDFSFANVANKVNQTDPTQPSTVPYSMWHIQDNWYPVFNGFGINQFQSNFGFIYSRGDGDTSSVGWQNGSVNVGQSSILTCDAFPENSASRTVCALEGDGTEDSPKLIKTGWELASIAAVANDQQYLADTVFYPAAGMAETDVHFKLANDIDLASPKSDTAGSGLGYGTAATLQSWCAPTLDGLHLSNCTGESNEETIGWHPIYDQQGTYPPGFASFFEGNGKKITNLRIGTEQNRAQHCYSGLFGATQGGGMKNLQLEGSIYEAQCYYSGYYSGTGYKVYAGMVAGQNSHTEISNLTVQGVVDVEMDPSLGSTIWSAYVGGVFGQSEGGSDSEMRNLSVNANVKFNVNNNDSDLLVGGIAGDIVGYTVKNTSVKGSVTGSSEITSRQSFAGGMFGHAQYGTNFDQVYSEAQVNLTAANDACAGGLAGWFDSRNSQYSRITSVKDAYAAGNVHVTSASASERAYAGGIAGRAEDQASLEHVMSLGDVISENTTGSVKTVSGGIIGEGIQTPYGDPSIVNSISLSRKISASGVAAGAAGEAARIGAAGTFYAASNYAFTGAELSYDGGATWAQAGQEGASPQTLSGTNGLGIEVARTNPLSTDPYILAPDSLFADASRWDTSNANTVWDCTSTWHCQDGWFPVLNGFGAAQDRNGIASGYGLSPVDFDDTVMPIQIGRQDGNWDPGASAAGPYAVSYNANGGTGSANAQATEATGDFTPYTLAAAGFTAPAGKNFAYWCNANPALSSGACQSGNRLEAGVMTNVTGDTTLYAMYFAPALAFNFSALVFDARDYDSTSAITPASGTASIASDTSAYPDVTFSSCTYSFANKNAGASKGISATCALTGSDASRYTLANPYTTGKSATVTPKDTNINSLSVSDKVYDGTTSATLDTTLADVTVLPGDDLGFAGCIASFADKNVGDAKAVSISGCALTGSDAANYSLQANTGLTGKITERTGVTITARDAYVVQGQNLVTTSIPADFFRTTGVLAGDSIITSGVFSFGMGCNSTTLGTFADCVVLDSYVSGPDFNNYSILLQHFRSGSLIVREQTVPATPADPETGVEIEDPVAQLPGNACPKVQVFAREDVEFGTLDSEIGAEHGLHKAWDIRLVNCVTGVEMDPTHEVKVRVPNALKDASSEYKLWHKHFTGHNQALPEAATLQTNNWRSGTGQDLEFITDRFSHFGVSYLVSGAPISGAPGTPGGDAAGNVPGTSADASLAGTGLDAVLIAILMAAMLVGAACARFAARSRKQGKSGE